MSERLRIGRVQGFPRYRVLSSGVVYAKPARPSDPPWRKVRVQKCPTYGYLTVTLSEKGTTATIKLHRLVLEAFIGPRPQGMVCRHLDGNKLNNRLSNLLWGTPAENAADRVLHGQTRLRNDSSQHRVVDKPLQASRTHRLDIFVNDQEYGVLRAVSPDDEALGRTIRRLAMDRAEWLAEHGRKQRGRSSPVRDDVPPNDGYTLDRSYAQD
jgi:hypothetical protein